MAQRVSTILDADLILVLDEGRLVGAGTHGELLETCPVYRAIADSQMQREGA
ncbi:Multidrug resistance ABC transporter ATP-binding/permease protein BmrA [Flavonifractor plautii]|uniref:Multidrug resistance ABC transporter ATP-binding/permease protein BmrA n=1 Tax=Flavonifractor plautii TaxID=292800 RepID=A0A174RB77_FLAPL|nr:Multidrug resistance ABC transporter ATP-binding/permease protein BmrA [Flavonifractor plautii]